MRARERKVGQIMVELRRRPRGRRVALRTSLRVAAGFMVRIIRCRVIRFMARPAIGWSSRELTADVTLGTVGADVRARQREVCVVVVE